MAKIPGLKEAMNPVPPGDYEVRIEEFKEKKTVGGDPMWSVRLRVTEDGPYQGRVLFDNFVLFRDPSKRWGIEKMAKFLHAVQVEVDEDGEFEPGDVINTEVRVTTDLTPDRETDDLREKVLRYLPV